MSLERIRNPQPLSKNPILFASSQFKGNRLSLLSVYFQTFAYYDGILTNIAIPLQLLIFIYKYNILYYESNTIAGEIILLIIGYAFNLWRLDLGKSGNKGKKYSAIFGYLMLSVIVMVGFVYVLAIQPNVLWLEFIIFIIALVIAGIEFLIMIVLSICYRVNQV